MSKPTGTVPKAKKRPNPSAQNNDEQQQILWPPVNNLQATDWHPARQTNSARDLPSSSDFAEQFAAAFMAAEGGSGPRSRQSTPMMPGVLGAQQHARARDQLSPPDLEVDTRIMNGVDHHQRLESGANALLDATKNNFSRIPDRNQVLSRLNQIRDYVKQTSALMDSLNGSTDLKHLAQAVKLSRMQSELQDSERKLVQMLDVFPSNDEGLTNGNAIPQRVAGGAIPKVRDQNQMPVNQQQVRRRPSSSEERSPGPTAAQYAKHQELKLKVEESQKKLQALVQHQAALISLQEKAQQQLRNPNSQEFLHSWTDRADSLTGQFQDLSTNEVVGLLGEQDKELDAEYMAIQERLQEIHDRKRTVDRLNRDMQAMQPTNRDREEQNSSSSEEEEEITNGEASFVDVDAKVQELNNMKARLASLQSLVAAINQGEMPYESIKSALAANEASQRRDHSRSSSSKPDNIFRGSDTMPKALDDQAMEIRMKAQQLDKAKQKLQQLKEILHAAGVAEDDMDGQESVNSYSSTGRAVEQQIPNQELEQLMRIYLQQPKPKTPSPVLPHRKNKNVKPDVTSTVHAEGTGRNQRAFMQAKRQELEEMMRKDQGQSSINQDTCHTSGLGLSVSDTGATWGGSMISAVPSQSEQQPSINCSSEELAWETDLAGPHVALSTPRLQSLAPSAFRQVQNAQKSPASNKPPIWPEPPIESSTPIYDVPPRSGSSAATPRPMGDEATPHAQWWLLQQQLEASNAACQSMMQQWQWGAPSPENWWPSSPIAAQMMTTLSQCCQMLWMQQREIMNLHATIQNMQERFACSEQNFPTPFNNSSDANAAATVSGAHSLPNLCEGPPQFLLPGNTHFPWTGSQPPNNVSALPPMIRHCPPVTLNNQVPPGVRANNYWDNFRSYSRQNLLSTSTKLNDGQLQHPSPLTDRSHNSLRSNEESQPSPSRTVPQQSRKQKLNSERPPIPQHVVLGPTHNPGPNSNAEQLFTELASLVAHNQSRPEFLPQLFRELKGLRCTSDCQRVLSSIREIGRREELISLEEASVNGRAETPEGAAALPTTKSPQRQVNENQVDSKIQSLLLQLMPFLKSRREDCCTPALLEIITQRTLSHLTIAHQPVLNTFVQNQLSGRLVDALAKFQGCWLRDVGEELLATVAEVLLKELAFFKLLENVSQADQNSSSMILTNTQTDSLQTNNSDLLSPDDQSNFQLDSSDSEMGEAAVPTAPPQRNCWLPAALRDASKAVLEARAEAAEVDLCDADLAEADQSHDAALQEVEGRGSQAEGAATPEMARQLDNLEAITLSAEQQPALNDDAWQVEQDRELDQVPSRLEPGDATIPPGPPSGP
ncbi:uncharacterized protein LOC132205045 isoform X2 [Neocloeon triangulifer]|uniref:uncharacterized protein LOC132205045 isoform X2 n=1 Tax=Neocloeon triangulifer TaxID=2078957 RepID=UPI00286F6823|nr:uncharacterized protein LOC132205045 isoform X2 [Neocloeon triangulifer]